VANEVPQNHLQQHGARRDRRRVVDRSEEESVEFCSLEVDAHAVKDALTLYDACNLALVKVQGLDYTPVFFSLGGHRREIGKVWDIDVYVGTEDLSAASLREQALQIRVTDQLFNFDFPHAVQMRLDPA
jgi:hypothetical protein